MQLGDLLDEGQAETGTLLATVRPRERIEPVEYAPQGIVGNAGSFVPHGQVRLITDSRDADFDPSTFRREVEGVLDQIRQRACKQQGIAAQVDVGFRRKHDAQAPPLRLRLGGRTAALAISSNDTGSILSRRR